MLLPPLGHESMCVNVRVRAGRQDQCIHFKQLYHFAVVVTTSLFRGNHYVQFRLIKERLVEYSILQFVSFLASIARVICTQKRAKFADSTRVPDNTFISSCSDSFITTELFINGYFLVAILGMKGVLRVLNKAIFFSCGRFTLLFFCSCSSASQRRFQLHRTFSATSCRPLLSS